MAGTIGLSLTQRIDKDSLKPLAGGRLSFFEAGTVADPQDAFQDSGLTIPWPNPMTLDSGGNIPQLFFADGNIKVRLTNKDGVVQFEADNLLVVGASSGGGGGGSVDATTILATGDIKAKYGTGNLTGFVRLNGRSIGSATSGASERANADAQSLFEYLWQADSALAVSTGRGISANADWVANKNITLPDFRSRALAGLADMGNSDNALLAGLTFTRGTPTSLGALLGATKITIAKTNLPNLPLTVDIAAGQGSHNHTTGAQVAQSGSGITVQVTGSNTVVGTNTLPAMTGTTTIDGSSTPMETISPFALVTIYIKL